MILKKEMIHNDLIKATLTYEIGFEIGETVIVGYDGHDLHSMYRQDRKDRIVDIKISDRNVQTGCVVFLSRYNDWVSLAWINKMP